MINPKPDLILFEIRIKKPRNIRHQYERVGPVELYNFSHNFSI